MAVAAQQTMEGRGRGSGSTIDHTGKAGGMWQHNGARIKGSSRSMDHGGRRKGAGKCTLTMEGRGEQGSESKLTMQSRQDGSGSTTDHAGLERRGWGMDLDSEGRRGRVRDHKLTMEGKQEGQWQQIRPCRKRGHGHGLRQQGAERR